MKKLYTAYFVFLGVFLFHVAGYAQTEATNTDETERDMKIVFRVKWDGRVIPGITKVSELRRKTEVVTHRNGGAPGIQHRSPGITNYEPIVISRPRSSDREFEKWVNKVWSLGNGPGWEVSLKDFRKDIRIELCDQNGTVLLAFIVYRCWPSEYIAISKLDEDDPSLAMETIILQHEGWERDYEVK